MTCHKCFTSRVLVGPDDFVHRVHAANKHNNILPRLSGIRGMFSGMHLKCGGIDGERGGSKGGWKVGEEK